MNIEHERKDVIVKRYATIAEALGILTKKRNVLVVRMLGNRKTPEESEIAEVLGQPLCSAYEDTTTYCRTFARAVFAEKERMQADDLFSAIAEENYRPAGMSESAAYLRLLASEGVPIGTVLHLHTPIRTTDFTEKRLLVHSHGQLELIPFYPTTKLKDYYQVVLMRKPIKGSP